MWPRAGTGVTLTVTGANAGVVLAAAPNIGPGGVWTPFSATIPYDQNDTYTLAFTSISASGAGEHIDQVAFLVEVVPEPATASLALLALGGIGAATQIRR